MGGRSKLWWGGSNHPSPPAGYGPGAWDPYLWKTQFCINYLQRSPISASYGTAARGPFLKSQSAPGRRRNSADDSTSSDDCGRRVRCKSAIHCWGFPWRRRRCGPALSADQTSSLLVRLPWCRSAHPADYTAENVNGQTTDTDLQNARASTEKLHNGSPEHQEPLLRCDEYTNMVSTLIQPHAALVCRLMVSTLIILVITWSTNHLPTPKVTCAFRGSKLQARGENFPSNLRGHMWRRAFVKSHQNTRHPWLHCNGQDRSYWSSEYLGGELP